MTYAALKKSVSDMIEVGYDEDLKGRAYDIINLSAIVLNLAVTIMITFDDINLRHGTLLGVIETVTVVFFAIDYALRIWTASCIFPNTKRHLAPLRYIFSFNGLVDFFSCVPFFLPFFFPSGVAAFRIFRVVRIFRLFRINAYFDSLNVITAVIRSKAKLLLSSTFVVCMIMLAASLCMYSIEHSVQPKVFNNALSGLWWAAAALLTVGYGDIYPVTTLGKCMGIIITMLGVGMVAIPTGIISAGFVEKYQKLKKVSEQGIETGMRFIQVTLSASDEWTGRAIRELELPAGIIVAAVFEKGKKMQIPRGDTMLYEGDIVILGAESIHTDKEIELKEIELKDGHEWNGVKIKDLDISRQSFIVMIRRAGKTLIPNGGMMLKTGDAVYMYTGHSQK
ncbi:MAG: ion transporter [Lachnospiraceae bacterium]|nr:ion transporter [Lachnospiraceae bacterium]